MKRILLLMWVLLLGISMQAQTTITVTSENTLASQLASPSLSTVQSTLIITGTLTVEDFEALNSNTYSQLASVTKLDLSGATVASISDMTDMNLSAMEYLRLPDGMTSADDVAAMANLHTSSKNAALKMAGAQSNTVTFNGVTTNNKEVAVYSFVPNSSPAYKNAFSFVENAKSVRMAGTFGVNDLIDTTNNNTPIYGWNGVVGLWDFTGASFEDCTISAAQGSEYSYQYKYQTESGDKHHYDINDPFKEDMDNATLGLPPGYETNAFYYFFPQGLAKYAVDIKLPTGIDALPPACLTDLASDNKSNYMALTGKTQEEFNSTFGNNAKYVPIETLVIPNNYEILDHECALEAKIKNLYIGNGVKEIRGGAFVHSETLENLDFAAGISDCKIGNLAFGECKSMKHIALAEGIISIGANAFSNSQHLESIRLPESLIYIGNEAFNNCLALNSITIPANVEKIGQRAFRLCPFTDIYLTTTDPAKIPVVWSVGNFTEGAGYDENASFHMGHYFGWGGFSGNTGDNVDGMTWDEAAAWYYIHVNGLPVLHYPTQLADKVKAIISADYDATSSDGYKLPANREDMSSRAAQQIMSKYSDVTDLLASDGKGTYTQNGWAQFVLMKEYVPGNEDIVYTKEYSDVWYTMCFPFDLTDEQLAAAFNETFNIADFSGVEVVEKTETDPLKLVLHFNKVAVTYYKDTNDKVYYRLCDDGSTVYRGEPGQTVWREQHGTTFKYNVYVDPDDPSKIYHHVDANDKLVGNKTKTFALGNSLEEAAANKDNAIIIDGILAEAGHPYMIHPAIGVNPGQPKRACNMAGITWKNSPNDKERASSDYDISGEPSVDEYRDWLFNHMARTVDLGHKSTQQEKWDNYDQADYTSLGYAGNTYTFKGNPRDFKDGWQNDASLPARPADAELVEPKAPQNPNPKPKAPKKAELSMPDNPEDNHVDNPAEDTETYPAKLQTFYYSERPNSGGSIWGDLVAGISSINEISDYVNVNEGYAQTKYDCKAFNVYFGYENANLPVSVFNDGIGTLKSKCASFKAALVPYNNYLADVANYPSKLQAYQDSKAEWDRYRAQLAEWNSWQAPADEQAAYDAAYSAWQTAVTNYNTWKTAMGNKGYNVVIPQYAYFLGTPAGAIYPKYFRERSDKQDRSTGLWTQYSAIILPNAAALAGLETDLGGVTTSGSGTAGAKNHDIAFDEKYFFIDDTPQGIATLIEKIEKEEGKAPEVEYMDIVVSIDGKIVSRDKTTFEGLPKGIYIINGKKYYVK